MACEWQPQKLRTEGSMVHSTLTHPLLAACCLAWSSAACTSKNSSSSRPDAPGFDGAHMGDGGSNATPQCNAGDRTEVSGLIPSTTLAVAVCSKCGESYVVASNGGSSTAQVSIDNGSATKMIDVPAGGTAMTAALADNPADGTVAVCSTTGSRSCLATPPQNQRYCNPFRAVPNLNPERIDQGVDYGGAGSIYAMGPGIIDVFQNRTDAGWPGGTFVSYKLSAGPASGRTIYLAENIDLDPALHSGSFVYSGTVLGTLVNASPDSESGWGVQGASYTAEHSCYVEGCTTALGNNFNQLLVCLSAPSGIPTAQTTCCPSSAGYPADWCTLVSAWQ
jgi:hypothetical protein